MQFSLITKILGKQFAKLSLAALVAGSLSLSVVYAQSAKSLPQVQFTTSMGQFTVELEPEKAPKTVTNFLAYVNSGFYTGTIFHRVINGFMIQGGGFTKELVQKPTRAPIPIESDNGLKNTKYSIAMARTNDPNSATAQFFVNVKDNAMLDYPSRDGYGYTVFGRVVAGMETIDNIKFVDTNVHAPTRMSDVPVKAIVIESAKVIK